MSSPILLTLNWTSGSGYSMTPANPNVNTGGTVRFSSPDKPCTVHFSPSTTPFGASVSVAMGGHRDVLVGAADYSVQYTLSLTATAGMAATAPHSGATV